MINLNKKGNVGLNPLNPKSDQHLFSSHNINALSEEKRRKGYEI